MYVSVGHAHYCDLHVQLGKQIHFESTGTQMKHTTGVLNSQGEIQLNPLSTAPHGMIEATLMSPLDMVLSLHTPLSDCEPAATAAPLSSRTTHIHAHWTLRPVS